MISESVTGIRFQPPAPVTSADGAFWVPLLENIAASTANHLQRGGYLVDLETQEILAGYRSLLDSALPPHSGSKDFLDFLANYQSQKHSVPRDDEVVRMQRILARQLHEHAHYWSLGPIADPSHALYEQCPSLEVACRRLCCPAICAAEDIVHVAALNPFAGLVVAEWIHHDAKLTSGFGDVPFVFTLMVDFPSWAALRQRHFAS
jgi:hypothetical protein